MLNFMVLCPPGSSPPMTGLSDAALLSSLRLGWGVGFKCGVLVSSSSVLLSSLGSSYTKVYEPQIPLPNSYSLFGTASQFCETVLLRSRYVHPLLFPPDDGALRRRTPFVTPPESEFGKGLGFWFLGFRFWDLAFEVWGSGFGLVGFGVSGLKFTGLVLGVSVWGLESEAWGFAFGIFDFGVWGFVSRVILF